ncbi:N-acetylmuramic acid 6-phosphate etherase [Anaerococcus urinomassiliensis]|uniref:N-acetylmuramic acid 6-phosphate etherase n=1 Tax=Anaerococcus urinomassiliensis TaxID=1745712 RepID=UPI000939DD3C|nr:N-acetylmuramic acid 6-phosphate etherase [Anaerococcus urinomassiliensis]
MECKKNLKTETRNPDSMNLDKLSTLEIVRLMNDEDKKVSEAVSTNAEMIADLSDEVINTFKKGGRLVYIGSGTSGRLGVLDASECPPTFGVDSDMVIGLISGGQDAIYSAKEGMEDNKAKAIEDLKDIEFSKDDILVGIAASGRTPYVIQAIEYAKEIGAVTGSIVCNENSPISAISDYPIEAIVGPEVLTGSTRLKAGSAQKMILNMISTSSMVGIGKVYQNLMVDVKPTNDKLRKRAKNIVIEITKADEKLAKSTLEKTNWNVKEAICMIELGCNKKEAREKIQSANGFLKEALRDN